MSHIRAVFTGQGPSGLPEDRVVNVFHFTSLQVYESAKADAADALGGFYTVPVLGNPIGYYLSPWVSRTATITTYDMDEPKPRVPTVFPLALPPEGSTEGIPEEAACCLSFAGVIPPAITARRRGRLFIGPLNNTGFQAASRTQPSRPSTILQRDLVAAGQALLLRTNAPVEWVILSSIPAVNYVPVGSGWVDDALDTQRRRGPRPTSRQTFQIAAP